MKKITSFSLFLFLMGLTQSCGNAYKLELSSPKRIKINEKLSISVSEKNKKPIDSVRYYIDGERIENHIDIDISDSRLGKHAVSATVFFGNQQKQLTNTIYYLADRLAEIYTYEIVNTYPHDPNAFTQGLEYHDGYLYETTGQRGESSLRKVDISTGKVVQKLDLDDMYFGEGMTIFQNKIYMLTWQSKVGFVFDLHSFDKLKEFSYNESKEGWGLAHNGEKLIKSDGTERLWFLNPETLEEEGFIEVYAHNGKVTMLNELEYFNDRIYANKWQTNSIVIINPKNGMVEAIVDLKGLQEKSGQTGDDNILNGIAYDAENDRLFVTGKDWNKLYEIKLLKKQ
ncbi:glutaminyl-peptide cyclotransferase [Flavobacteriaceae bacterium F08102]|nr:glutaminyl-peptide cyclotransferase [Flavobacteriaceae bacterium F08102]